MKSSLIAKERALAQSPVFPLAPERADVPAAQGKSRRTWTRLLTTAWVTWRTHVFAALDQVVVSGTAFLTTVLVGRWTFPSELGIYSVGFSLLASLLAFQDSLILLPYTIQRHRPLGTPAEHAGSSLMQSGLLSVLGIVAMAAAALGMSAYDAEPKLTAMIWAMAAVVPFVLLREFGRGFVFARLEVGKALILDIAVAVTQLGALGWLGLTGRMSSTNACIALGAACALPGMAWLSLARADFAIRAGQMRDAITQSWTLGKWLCAGQITVSVQGYATYWLLPLLLDLTATGVFAACMSIASLANPLVSAFRSTLTPRAVAAFKEGGGANLRRQAIRDSLLLGAVMASFCIVVMLGSELAMGLLFHDQKYVGHGHIITVLAVAVTVSAVGSTASNALASMERPHAIVWAALVGAVVTVVAVWFFALAWGLAGAAYGFLAGNAAGAVARWFAFLRVVSQYDRERNPAADLSSVNMDSDRAAVIRVLQQFTRYDNDRGYEIAGLGEGFQAKVYAVDSQSGQPIWQTHHRLAVKLYRPASATNFEMVKREFEAQSELHSVLDGRSINGWKICAPVPLYASEKPLALVMTTVTGRSLELSLTTDDSSTLESVARAVVAAMKHYWSAGQLHGDLSLRNILWDTKERSLSFVDVDALVNSSAPDGITKEWYPASYDLAGMLYDLGVDIRCTRHVLLRKQMFAESVLRAFLGTIGPLQKRLRFLEELHAYTQAELNRLDFSWSMRGLYRVLQRRIASRRIDRLLASIVTSARVSSHRQVPNTLHFKSEGTELDA